MICREIHKPFPAPENTAAICMAAFHILTEIGFALTRHFTREGALCLLLFMLSTGGGWDALCQEVHYWRQAAALGRGRCRHVQGSL